ncbi:MAG: hypothetical protein KF752_20585 [Pirellulaceae bacterium]|nr:hypothetical protein [Pirellulaceae bacterium]
MSKSSIHNTMCGLVKAMSDWDLPIVIAGEMAANAQGQQRTKAEVHILTRREDLQRFKLRFGGLGWVDKFEGSKYLRDATTNVNMDVLIAGDYPRDGVPKPAVFPVPEKVSWISADGVHHVILEALLELRIAIGISARHRIQYLADVVQLIRVNRLPRTFAAKLSPYVADTFDKLWQAAQVNDDY